MPRKGELRPANPPEELVPVFAPDETDQTLPEMVLQAIKDKGGVEYIKQLAIDDPKTFLALVTKVMPTKEGGEGDSSLQIQVINYGDAR